MDSLLDTMTNVVGILVILLVVTKLGVSSAMSRIRSNLPEVSEEQYKNMQLEASLNLKEMNRLKGLKDNSSVDVTKSRAELAELEKRLNDLKTKIPGKVTSNVDALRKSLSDVEKNEAQLNSSLADLNKKLAELKKVLAETKKQPQLPAKIIRIPDPRPAPVNARAEWFACRDGKITYIDMLNIAAEAAKRISFLKTQLRYGKATISRRDGLKKPSDKNIKSPEMEYDRKKIEEYFQNTPLTVSGHRVFVYGKEDSNGCWINLKIAGGQGENEKVIVNGWSIYRRALKGIMERKNFARFLVYPDSFEVYLAARDISEQANVPAGWDLYDGDQWRTWVQVPGIRVHREKEPPPPDPDKQTSSPKPAIVLD